MAHEMTENDSAVYYKERAWHGLGNVVERSMSVMDAYDKSGLNWEVEKSEGINVISDNMLYTNEYRGIVRTDTQEVLGIVSPQYQVVQNHEVFDLAQYFSSVATVESAGSVQGGRKNYLLLHSDSFEATDNDPMERYMALIWGHDGASSLIVKPTAIRVVCKNTMDMVLGSKTTGLTIKHNGNIEEKMADARLIISQYRETGNLFQREVQHLARKPLSVDGLRQFFFRAYEQFWNDIPTNPETSKEENAYEQACRTILNWENTFESETVDIPPSPWVAVNAVTNYIQHNISKRGRKATEESKAFSRLNGPHAKKTSDIMQMALSTF